MANNGGMVIPENEGNEQGGNRRDVVKKVTAPQNPSIKNPTPIKIEMRGKDARQYALDEANKLISKFKKQLSISTQEVPKMGGGMEELTKYIKKMDPQNSSGAVKPALDILDKLLKEGNQNPLSSIPGVLGGLMGQLQQVLSQIAKENKQVRQPQPDPTCPKGEKWDKTKQTCVVDPNAPPNFLEDE